MYVRRLLVTLSAALAAAPLLAGCATGAADDGRPHVVTSFYALQYVAQRIVGDHAEVTNLTHPGTEPHDLELEVRQIAAVADADLVVYEKGFQAAVDQAVEQNSPAHVVDAAEVADLRGDDPHFWLDPVRLAKVAAAVEQQVAEADPGHRSAYADNLRALQRDLHRLDRDIEAGLADCESSTVVVSHDAFEYFGERYGLHLVAINGLSPDAEPSLAHIRELQDLIRSDGITTVFAEELGSRKLADSLAHDLGVATAVLDPVEGLSEATAGEDYLSLMRHNLTALEKANQCR